MRKIHLTRRSKIITGIIVVVVVAVLVVGFGTGLPGTGQKFMGAATGGSSQVDLMSDWGGISTGVITVTNTESARLLLVGYKYIGYLGGKYQYQGRDVLEPGESKSYDYKGCCKIEFWLEADTVPLYMSMWVHTIDGINVSFMKVANPEWTERGSGGGAGNELNLR